MQAPRDWPAVFTLAGYTDRSSNTQSAYHSRGTGGLYAYAGRDQRGDRGVLLSDFAATTETIRQAQAIELAQEHPVMPVLVHYTACLEVGDTVSDLANRNHLKIHFMNLIRDVQEASQSSRCAFILSPGFLGKLQQRRAAYPPYQALFHPASIAVSEMLGQAVAESGSSDAPPAFSDDVKGYCQAINWICKNFGPRVTFGWVVSPWQAGDSDWVVDPSTDATAAIAGQVNGFLDEIGACQGIVPDFLVFDANGTHDDFSPEAIPRGHAWNATAWRRYLQFVGEISRHQKVPALLWRISGAHIPSRAEGPALATNGHAGTGGTFFLGDAAIGKDAGATTTLALLSMQTPYPAYGAARVRALFEQDQGFDWSTGQIPLAIANNVFAIFFGGPESTSIVSVVPDTGDAWLAARTTAYYEAPTPL